MHACIHVFINLVDVDECVSNLHNCSHNCINTNNSYTCSCPNGLNLSADERTCSAPPSLVLTLTDDSGYITLNSSNMIWKIRIPNNQKVINLTFVSFSVSCSGGGTVKVFSGYDPLKSVLLTEMCGIKVSLSPIISSINELSIMHTNGSEDDKALLQYKTVSANTNG